MCDIAKQTHRVSYDWEEGSSSRKERHRGYNNELARKQCLSSQSFRRLSAPKKCAQYRQHLERCGGG